MSKRLVVYVAGPYSATEGVVQSEVQKAANVQTAVRAGLKVMQLGHTPLVPHLSHYSDAYARRCMGWVIPYEDWMTCCFDWLDRCDALLYLGSSPGADRELARARELGMPVYRSLGALERHEPEGAE